MKEKALIRLTILIIASATLLVLSGCSAHYSGYRSDGGRAYYDQYVERPGYYDFSRPVIFVPDNDAEKE